MTDYTPEEEEAWKALEEGAHPSNPAPIIPGAMQVGNYLLYDIDADVFGISRLGISGESGVFSKKEFEAYIHAFFGLNF